MRFSNEFGSCEISDLPGCDQLDENNPKRTNSAIM